MKKRTVLIYIIMVALVCLSCFACSGGGEVRMERMNFALSSTTVTVGESKNLSLVVRPIGANEEILWNSSSPSVATVENGIVTAHSNGSATITAWTNSGITTTCEVKVIASEQEDDGNVSVGVSVDGKIVDYVYTSAQKDYLIKFPKIKSNEIDGNCDFSFGGWYLDAEFTQPANENAQFSEDCTIYAKIYDIDYSNYEFEEIDGGWAVKKYNGVQEVVSMPSYYDNKPITEIKSYAFEDDGVKKVITGSRMETIEDAAFLSGEIETVVLSKSVSSVTGLSFGGNKIKVEVSEDNANFLSKDGNLYSKDGKTLVFCSKTVEYVYAIDEGVEIIGDRAFYNCDGLTSIIIPDSVVSIGERAFMESNRLISVIIPDSVVSIGGYAFSGCPIEIATMPAFATSYIPKTYLKTVKITSGERIEENAFNECEYLENVTLPPSITSIGEKAFNCCKKLSSIKIPASVTSIEKDAFRFCRSLNTISIPAGVTSISAGAFSSCYGLVSVTIPDSVTSIGFMAFGECINLFSITIPDSVISIGNYAFYNCDSLGSVTIPDSVISIGYTAFDGCDELRRVTIGASVESMGHNVFPPHENFIIYCKMEGAPSGWDSNWNNNNHLVYWAGEWEYVDGMPKPKQ